MPDRVPGPHERIPTLHQLIRDRMDERGWSYSDLERASGRALTRGRWQQLGSGVQQKKFPDPASLTVIAQVLEVDITTVVLAAARSVDLPVHRRGSELAHLLPAGSEQISERMSAAILSLVRALVAELPSAGLEVSPETSSGLTFEWPKSAAPSRRSEDGATSHGR